ncbi:MAG: DUF4142 domain-containing protein [Chitinophagaceae bacterium]|nr:DUF4142 domain-containing protein [Chitinophagaceae bacterium]
MNNTAFVFTSVVLSALLTLHTSPGAAQAMAPEKSANAAAMSDSRFIITNIQDNQDAMILLQKAADHSTNSRIKELAQQMIEDHTSMLYSLQELNAAGAGGSTQNALGTTGDAHIQASKLEARLSGASGSDFDTMWVANMLIRDAAKFDELSQAKTSATNPQLKMAITEALPIVRRHRSQLNMLQKDLAKMAIQKKKQSVRATTPK